MRGPVSVRYKPTNGTAWSKFELRGVARIAELWNSTAGWWLDLKEEPCAEVFCAE